MEYIHKQDNNMTYYYEVNYDENKFKEVLDRLKQYSYECFCNAEISGNITKFPATKKNILNRINKYMNEDKTVYVNSITRHNENNKDYVTYEYSYSKYPDLYDYIDLLINDRDILCEKRLFASANEPIDMFYIERNKEQCILDALLNYKNSYELSDINKYNNENDSFDNFYYQDFDHNGLRNLYIDILAGLKFKLLKVETTIENNEVVQDYAYILKRK